MNTDTINLLPFLYYLALGLGCYAYGHKAGRKDGIKEVFESVRKGDSYETASEVIYGEVLPT